MLLQKKQALDTCLSLQISQIHVDVMLVGHLPFMERMTAYLITGSFEKPVFKLRGRGVFLNNSSMDDFFLKPHELAARDCKQKTEDYL